MPGGKVNISEFDTEEAEADYVTSTIQYLLSLQSHDEIEGELSLDKMVVIARNRFVFSKLERSLKKSQYPTLYEKVRGNWSLQQHFGKVLDYALRIKLNPKDWVDGKKLCQVLSIAEPESWTSETLLSMAAQVSFVKGERAELLS
ncbi:hypothetical protein [Providencia hangzhouensis]|uniref:hypothetical protein n=1 Tax=Providencia hangzhouensis TaxID=3031799 RepID=UPI0034DD512F